jgi:glutathionylspermidine synthase
VFAARLARRGPTAPAADPVAFWETIEGRRYALDAVVPLEAREVAAIRRTAQEAWGIYKRVAPLVRAFPDEGLVALGLPAVAHDVVRLEDLRAGETLVARFDLLGENGTYRVVELNAETPFFLVESFVENGRRARAAGYGDPNAGELERLGDAFHAALQPLALGARIGVVASNVYREDVGTALFLRDVIAARVAAQTVFVPVHELAIAGGRVCDASGPLDVLYRCYPLEHFAADRGGAALFAAVRGGACRLLNPPSALPLQSKATQALIWGLMERGEYFEPEERETIARTFLPTYLDWPGDGRSYVRKPVLGREGGGVEILDARADVVARGEGRYEDQLCVFQRYIEGARRSIEVGDGARIEGIELVTCFIVGGRASAVGMRLGGVVTDTSSYFVPVGLAP